MPKNRKDSMNFYKIISIVAIIVAIVAIAQPHFSKVNVPMPLLPINELSTKGYTKIDVQVSTDGNVGVVVIDEIHLLNDPSRGPTLEVLITLLRRVLKNLQIVGLSATIGNPEELAEWLGARLVEDDWRSVKLRKGVYLNVQLEFVE